MGRGYQNVRATGGAVKPLPWRGHRGLGYRSKPSLGQGRLDGCDHCRGIPAKRYVGQRPAKKSVFWHGVCKKSCIFAQN